MKQYFYTALCLVLFTLSISVAETPQRLSALDDSFQRELNREIEPLDEKYLGALENLQRTFSKSGNLDAALFIKEEIERAKKKEPPKNPDEDSVWPPEFESLQKNFAAAIERKASPVIGRYQKELSKLQGQYTSGNDLEAAVLVRNRLEQLTNETVTATVARVVQNSGPGGGSTALKKTTELEDWLQTKELYWQGNTAGVILRFSGDEVIVVANGSEIFRREFEVEEEDVFTFLWSSDDLNTFTLSRDRETFERKMDKTNEVMRGKVRDR